MLEDKFSWHLVGIAAGLVGDGSECFGYDDENSLDHDWGAAICLWLNRGDYEAFGKELQAELDNLPKSFRGYPVKAEGRWGSSRTGVFEIGQFYCKFIGIDHPPQTLL